MGCRAVTPHLVSLARRLEGRPFHLIASHCQAGTKEEVVGYIKSKKLAPDTPNMTVTKQGRHPGVKGNGYVPYYMVFDHKGQLAHHHMCGDYHGGDGLAMIEWVDKLLAQTPAIYLGEDPFRVEAALADQVGKKKNLKGALATIEKKLQAPDAGEAGEAELKRLQAAITDYRDRMLASADTLLRSKPSETLPALKVLSKEFGGTSLAEPIDARIAELTGSKDFKDALAIEKKLAKIVRSMEKRKPCKGCKRKGLDGLNAGCSTCRTASKAVIEKTLKKLDALIEGKEHLSISKAVERYAASWRK